MVYSWSPPRPRFSNLFTADTLTWGSWAYCLPALLWRNNTGAPRAVLRVVHGPDGTCLISRKRDNINMGTTGMGNRELWEWAGRGRHVTISLRRTFVLLSSLCFVWCFPSGAAHCSDRALLLQASRHITDPPIRPPQATETPRPTDACPILLLIGISLTASQIIFSSSSLLDGPSAAPAQQNKDRSI